MLIQNRPGNAVHELVLSPPQYTKQLYARTSIAGHMIMTSIANEKNIES